MIFRKNVLRLALPIMIEQTFVMLLGVCNTMMAGHLGAESVSAIGMVDSMNNMFISFFAALSVGATVVVAQHIGREDIKKANDTVKQALASGMILSITITLIMWLTKSFLISSFYGSATELVKSNASIYLQFTLLTYPFIAIQQISNGILRGSGDSKTPMYITMFMNIINVILGYILIYGIHINVLSLSLSTPSFGIEGAALAIAIARLIGAFIIIKVLFRGTRVIRLKKILPFKFDMKTQKNIFNIGIPAGIEQLLFNAGKLIVQIFIVTMGTVSIASNTIGMSVSSMINVVGAALSMAATTLVGQYIGRNDIKGARNTLIYLVKFSTVVLVGISILFVPIASNISRMYTDNEEVIKLSATLIRSNSIAMLVWPISFVLSGGLKGAGDTRYTMVTAIIGMWAFRIGTGYVLGIVFGIGVLGIWLGMYIDWLVRGTLYCIRLKGDKWIRHRIKA
jgi:putative MATE family efflux protein